MLRKVLIFVLLTGSLSAQSPLKIMTYNLQGMKPGTDPETRLVNIIEKLKEIDPDIIGLQEINESLSGGGNDNQAKVIADSLSAFFGIEYNYYISFTHLSWDNQFKEYVGIISKYHVEQEGFLSLVPGVFPRKVVWNLINTPLGKINFFNTHLSYNSASVRNQQVQQIIPYIENIEASYPATGSVLTGDFNDPPTATSIQLLTNTGTDTFYISTFAEVNPGNPVYTFPSNAPNIKIDYVFYKNTGALSIDTSFIVMNQPYNGSNYCSDHFGVLTNFTKDVVGIDKSINNPELKFKLYQNYPNPFNPGTTISWQLTVGSMQTLKIYDVIGREVVTLVDEYRPAGSYKIEFYPVSIILYPASGIYFYQLKAGKFIQTKKLILIQ